jgi:hypothetical protein
LSKTLRLLQHQIHRSLCLIGRLFVLLQNPLECVYGLTGMAVRLMQFSYFLSSMVPMGE